MDIYKATTIIKYDQYDCLILTHPDFQILDQLQNHLKKENINIVGLNLKLSELLLTVPKNERSLVTEKWVTDHLASYKPGPVVCTQSGLLFEPELDIDPLALFRHVARMTRLVVLWLGDFTDKELFYAIPVHQHYRAWRLTDFLPYQPKVILCRIA